MAQRWSQQDEFRLALVTMEVIRGAMTWAEGREYLRKKTGRSPSAIRSRVKREKMKLMGDAAR